MHIAPKHISDTAHSEHLLRHIQEIETLNEELQTFFTPEGKDLGDKDIRNEIGILKRLVDHYELGDVEAETVSEASVTLLSGLRDRLKLAADELLRLEGEAGNTATQAQTGKIEALLKVVRHVDEVVSDISQ